MEFGIQKLIAEKWIEAFRKHDIKGLLDLYHDNATHYSPKLEDEKPETKGWLLGKEQLKEWWQKSFDDLHDLNYELKDLTINGSKILMEYIRKASGQPSKYVMEYLKIEGELIIESRVLRSWPLEN